MSEPSFHFRELLHETTTSALERLRRHGWVQKAYWLPLKAGGGCCIMGAFVAAARYYGRRSEQGELVRHFRLAFEEVSGGAHPVAWNDHPLRTEEDVLSMMTSVLHHVEKSLVVIEKS